MPKADELSKLTKFGRCEQYIIDSMVYWLANEVDRGYICLKRRLHELNLISRRRRLAVIPGLDARDFSCAVLRFCGFFQVFIVTLRKRHVPNVRGTQREYSSKPLKHSIFKRILVFKR